MSGTDSRSHLLRLLEVTRSPIYPVLDPILINDPPLSTPSRLYRVGKARREKLRQLLLGQAVEVVELLRHRKPTEPIDLLERSRARLTRLRLILSNPRHLLEHTLGRAQPPRRLPSAGLHGPNYGSLLLAPTRLKRLKRRLKLRILFYGLIQNTTAPADCRP